MTSSYARYLVLSTMFAGLAYVVNLAMLMFTNVSLAFLVVFLAGYLTGPGWGLISGALAFFLISYFNPYGMALIPLAIGQIGAGAAVGLLGALAYGIMPARPSQWQTYPLYALWGLLASGFYMVVITILDAFLFGPFKQRFLIGMGFSILTIASNVVIFTILVPLFPRIREMAGVQQDA